MKPVLEVKSDCSQALDCLREQDAYPSPSEEISGGSGWPLDEEGRPIPYDEIEKLDYSSFSSPSK